MRLYLIELDNKDTYKEHTGEGCLQRPSNACSLCLVGKMSRTSDLAPKVKELIHSINVSYSNRSPCILSEFDRVFDFVNDLKCLLDGEQIGLVFLVFVSDLGQWVDRRK